MAEKEREVIQIEVASDPAIRHAIKNNETQNIHGRVNKIIDVDTVMVKIGYNFFEFANDATFEEVMKNTSIKDNVYVLFCFTGQHEKRILRFINHTKGYELVNSEYVRCMSEMEAKKKRREMHHKILFETLQYGGDLFLLAKQVNNDVVLVGLTPSGYPTYDTAINFLKEHNISGKEIDKWVMDSTPLGELEQVPGHEGYLFGAFASNEKIHDCRCGAEACSSVGRNHTIKSNSEWYCMCEYCFFDKMRIKVPENFYESMKGKDSNVQV